MKRLTADQERIEEAVLWVSMLRPGEENGVARDGSGADSRQNLDVGCRSHEQNAWKVPLSATVLSFGSIH